MSSPKRHLLISGTQTVRRTACGLRDAAQKLLVTTALADVTCRGCQKSLHMADRELANRHRTR